MKIKAVIAAGAGLTLALAFTSPAHADTYGYPGSITCGSAHTGYSYSISSGSSGAQHRVTIGGSYNYRDWPPVGGSEAYFKDWGVHGFDNARIAQFGPNSSISQYYIGCD